MFEQIEQGEQIQAVIASQNIIECITELHDFVNDETLGVTIPPLGLFCQKTGALIGERAQISLFSLHKLCGKEAIVGNLYGATSFNVHPAWIVTTGEALDDLMEQDPVNYACYCFGLITNQFYQTSRNKDQRRKPWAEKYWSMARANALMLARGVGGIDELNLELHRALIYAPDTLTYIFKRVRSFAETPDALAQLAVSGDLMPILRDATDKVTSSIGMANIFIKQTRYVDIALSAADAARGPSNMRKQKRTKRDIAETAMMVELQKMFQDVGGFGYVKNSEIDYSKFRENIQERAEAEESSLLDELGSIASNFSLDDANEEEPDLNTVEVHTIVWDVVFPSERSEPKGENPLPVIQQESPDTYAPNSDTIDISDEPKVLTLRERLAALQAAKKVQL